jgi:transcriptional regulator with XRE-family HTH domain
MVLLGAMSIYSDALRAFLDAKVMNQSDLAEKADCTQAAISRYASGQRLPPFAIADKIDRATEGQVPLSLWRIVAAKKAGLDDTAEQADAA